MKKIAVYFAGRIFGYEHCIEKLRTHFYNKYDVDFYWSVDEDYEKDYCKVAASVFKPIATNYEKLDTKVLDMPHLSRVNDVKERNMLNMFYHIMKCTQLIEQQVDKSYHAIVRFRTEIDSTDDFCIEDVLLDNTVYIPHGFNYRGINDRIAFGNYQSMIIYGYLYNHIPTYVYTKFALYNPEYLVMFHIMENNMNIIRTPYNFKHHQLRHHPHLQYTGIEKQ
jgi:hypothetical protein